MAKSCNGDCLSCIYPDCIMDYNDLQAQKMRERYAENPQPIKDSTMKWRRNNREQYLGYLREYHQRDYVKAKDRARYQTEEYKARQKEKDKGRKEYFREYQRKRRLALKNGTQRYEADTFCKDDKVSGL